MASTAGAANSTTRSAATEPSGAAEEAPSTNVPPTDDRVHDGAAPTTTTTQPEPNNTPPKKGTPGGKGKLKAGTKGKGKKGKDAATTYCANCGEEGDARCGGCGVVYYCRKNIVIKNGKKVNMCQQVRALTSAALTRARALRLRTHLHNGTAF